MAVLTREVILAEIEAGRLVISPFAPDQLGSASIDLTLGDEIRIIDAVQKPIELREEADYRDHTRIQRLDEPYVLEPGCTIHGITLERISLPPDLCGFLEGRSRFARLGLMIHVTSAFIQPGVNNRQVLEMSNVAGQPLRIYPGVRLCQLVLMRTEGEAVYRGRFADQEALQEPHLRAVAQRVSSARVSAGADPIFAMGEGLLVLVGVGSSDTLAEAENLARRLVHLRIFDDDEHRMNRSLLDVGGTLGLVSQFTLYGDARHGRRPSYGAAAPGEQAAPLIEALARSATGLGAPVVCGRFGAMMDVALVNSGPVTILLDTEQGRSP